MPHDFLITKNKSDCYIPQKNMHWMVCLLALCFLMLILWYQIVFLLFSDFWWHHIWHPIFCYPVDGSTLKSSCFYSVCRLHNYSMGWSTGWYSVFRWFCNEVGWYGCCYYVYWRFHCYFGYQISIGILLWSKVDSVYLGVTGDLTELISRCSLGGWLPTQTLSFSECSILVFLRRSDMRWSIMYYINHRKANKRECQSLRSHDNWSVYF